MKVNARALLIVGATGVGTALLAAPAAAHVSPDKSEVPAGGYTSVALTVGHGCGESPTRQVTIQVPDSIHDVTPEVMPGWDIEVGTEALDEPIEDGHGASITERESEVTFTAQSGNELANGFRQSYVLGFKAPETPGEHLFFKTIQTCVEGETAWIEEYTGEGDEPENPSPVVLVAEGDGGHGAEEPMDTPTDEDATDGTGSGTDAADGADDSDDGDASQGLAVAGVVLGALGIGAGGTALARARQPRS